MTTLPSGGDRHANRAMQAGMIVARNQERTHYSRLIMRLAVTLHDQGRHDAAAALRAATMLIDGTAEYDEVLDMITKTQSIQAIEDL